MNRWLTNNRKLLAVLLAVILLSIGLTPIIASNNNSPLEGDITIINVYSYPSVGGKWTVMFTTIGCADLIITAANGTTWSDSDNSCDLRFLGIRRGNETIEYEWVNGSVVVENYSSDEIGYETSKVLTTGEHTLMFQFGDDVAYAYNDASGWWNTSWGYRKLITVNSSLVDTDLSNFPILVYRSSDSDLASKAQDDGDDIAFVLYSDNSTQLNHEIEFFNDTTGELAAWVNVTYLSSTLDTKIWMYYNNSVCSSQENVDNTWDANYFGVWHLDDGSGATTFVDSSGYENNGSTSGGATPTWNASGKIGGAYTFDGNDRIGTGITTAFTDFSVEVWFNDDGDNRQYERLADKSYTGGFWFGRNSNTPDSWGGGIKETSSPYGIFVSLVDESWRQAVTIRDGTTHYMYGDGDTITSNTVTGTACDNTEFAIGAYGNGATSSQWFTGTIDEVRISDIARNSSWINTTYNTISFPSNFLIFGSEEWPVPVVSNPVPSNGSKYIAVPPTNFNITISHAKGYLMNITWRMNESGSWVTFNTTDGGGGGVGNGTYNTTNTSWVDAYSTKYWWSVNVTDGSSWTNRTYSFTTKSTDTTKPSSNVTAISPYWYGADDNPLSIICTDAEDDPGGDGVKNVTLYYYNSSDNSTWYGPWDFDVDTDPWIECSWSFNFPKGTGYYRFYSRAADNNSNIEDAPIVNDTMCGYDAADPTSTVGAISPYELSSSPLNITASASDSHTVVKNVSLWYRYSTDNITWENSGIQNWWNTTFEKRIPINLSVSSGSISENCTTLLNISFDADMQVDFDDLRFVRYTDNTTELDYWIEDKSDGNWANVWLEVGDVITTTNQTLAWMYYDNSTVESNSNGKNAFLFFDDFSDSDYSNNSWDQSYQTTGSWTVANGYAEFTSNGQEAVSLAPDVGLDDYIVEAETMHVGGPGSAMGLVVRANLTGDIYHQELDENSLDIYRFDDWVYNQLDTTSATPMNAGVWYKVLFRVAGNSLYAKSYTHGVTATATDAVYSSGRPGVEVYSQTARFDDFRVRKYASSEPTYYLGSEENNTGGWLAWSNASNPDTSAPWNWSFNFSDDAGYYEFYSIGSDALGNQEDAPSVADAICYYNPYFAPIINSYNLTNKTGSKLNNLTGLIQVNKEYTFTINITDQNGWLDIEYINITSWYDNGSDSTIYNQTLGGNLNMKLQYENTTATGNNRTWRLIWPDDETTLILTNCTETIINSTTRVINFSFIPGSQTRWANSNNTWLTTQNTTNDPYSWNFNITATDITNRSDYKRDEYGVYKYTSISADSDWVDVYALPGFYDDSSIVTITYSSNYNYNISIYFEENLTHTLWPAYYIPIAYNVTILADADPNDDITTDKNFTGILEANAIDIFNVSGAFQPNGTSQTVQVQFRVYVPFGTMTGKYTAHVATKISHD